MLKCRHCGAVHDEHSAVWREYMDRFGNWESREDGIYANWLCPDCGSDDVEEAYKCACCGEWCFDDVMVDDICFDCYEEGKTVDNVIEYTKREGQINDLAERLFGTDGVEAILAGAIEELCGTAYGRKRFDTVMKTFFKRYELSEFVAFLKEKNNGK